MMTLRLAWKRGRLPNAIHKPVSQHGRSGRKGGCDLLNHVALEALL